MKFLEQLFFMKVCINFKSFKPASSMQVVVVCCVRQIELTSGKTANCVSNDGLILKALLLGTKYNGKTSCFK